MGKLANFLWGSGETATAATATLPGTTASTISSLPPSVAAAFGINLNTETVTRAQAMSIAPMRRGRQIICGTLGSASLVAIRQRAGNDPVRLTRPLFEQPDNNVTRSYTLTWTFDDLIFYGVAWWLVRERDAQGFPSKASRIDPTRVTGDLSTGIARVDGVEVKRNDLIRFDGPDEGMLKHGGRTLRTALMLEEAVRNYARMDVPLGLFEDEAGAMEQDEIDTFLSSWEAARKSRSTGYTPAGIKYKTLAFNAEQLQLADARAYQATEIARMLNLPASSLNAPSNDSLTYATTVDNRRELYDITFKSYIAAIEQRLAMSDVTPIGTTVLLDLADFLRGDIKSVLDAAAVAISSNVLLPDEVRTEWLKMQPLPASPAPKADPNGP